MVSLGSTAFPAEARPSSSNTFYVLLMCIMLAASYIATSSVTSLSSAFDSTTFTVVTVGQPRRVDPSRAYDAASGELISNVYETLLFFGDKRSLPAATANVSQWGYTDLSQFQPLLATSLPNISLDRKTWTFTIRSGVRFHSWRTASGALISHQDLTAEDVEYTFKRMLVQDQIGAPSWMFCQPATGRMFFDDIDQMHGTNTIEPVGVDGAGERLVATLIDNFVSFNADTVTFTFEYAWPETTIMQFFSLSWSCIVNKAFCIEHGCWNGTFYDGWSTDYRRMPSNSYSPLDRYYNKSRYDPSTSGWNTGTLGDVPCMCGTGPYAFTCWDKASKTWRIDRFDDYWRGWTGQHVSTVIERGIDAWPTRKMLFLEGGADYISVPETSISDLTQLGQSHTPISGITQYYAAPVLSNEMLIFTFNIDPNSPITPEIGGSPRPDFFDNVHLRRAFAYAFNYTRFLQDRQSENVLHPATWWVKGLAPDYENKTLMPYDINLTLVEDELKAADVWNLGFEVNLLYVASSTPWRYVLDNLKDSIASLNEKRPGLPPFIVNVDSIDWPTYLDYQENNYMPLYNVGWLADYADPDNFARPYMHGVCMCTWGQCFYGPPCDPRVDTLVDDGLSLPDGSERNETYQQLQYIYWSEAWGIPLTQPLRSFWFRDWVRGFYYNELYLGLYFYDLYKEIPVSMEPVDLDIVS